MVTAHSQAPSLLRSVDNIPASRFEIALKSKPNQPARKLYLYDGGLSDIQTVTQIAEAAVSCGQYAHKERILNYYKKDLSILKGLEVVFSSNGIFYVAKDETGRSVGFIAANPAEDSRLSDQPFWNLNKLYMLPEYQGSGAGSSMMRLAMQEGIDRGYRLLYLQTVTDFEAAIALYEKMGFQRIPRCLELDDPICVEMIYHVQA